MRRFPLFLLLSLTLMPVTAPLWAHGKETHGQEAMANPVHALPKPLRKLFKKEMQRREEAMDGLLEAFINLDMADAARLAGHLQTGSLFTQLDAPGRRTYDAGLPEAFHDLERRHAAGVDRLASSTRAGDAAAALEGYAETLKGCVECHQRHGQAHFNRKK